MLSIRALIKRVNALVIISVLLLAGGLGSFASAAEIKAVPLNPRFIEWQKKIDTKRTSGSGKTSSGYFNEDITQGYIPSPINWSHLDNVLYSVDSKKDNNRQGSTLPTSYDLRSEMPPVRDQDPFGTCWTFASMAATESNLIHDKKILTKDNADLSEWYLAYYGFNDESEDLPSFTNGTTYPYYSAGGNDWNSTALMSRGTGAIDETLAKYPLTEEDVYKPAVTTRKYKLKNALYLGNEEGLEPKITEARRDVIKESIMEYGAVSIAILAGYDSAGYLNKDTGAYHTDGGDPNHAVAIVGWIDDYSKANFGKYKPSSDGAWIVRNSWGAAWEGSKEGYCYVSYEEKSLQYGVTFDTELAPDSNKEKIYQYDPLGLCEFIIYGSANPIYFANIFRAERKEKINSVSFYTSYPNTPYTVKIYANCGENPVGGKLVAEENLTIVAPGYNTVDLDSEVEIAKYSKFSVVVSYKLPDTASPSKCPQIPIEKPIKDYSEKATASAGQSFISSNGTAWDDLTKVSGYKNANVCIKAFGTSDNLPDGGGGGCSTGSGMIILLTLAVMPLMLIKKKR